MNYLREINAFYDWLETNSMSTSCIALWHALMAINNKAGWADEFTVAISTLETKTGLKKKTIERCRNTLEQKGLIDWRERKGNQSAIYNMNSLCVIYDPQTVPQYVAQSVSQDVPQHVAQSVAIIKLNKTKEQNALAVDARMHEPFSRSSDESVVPIPDSLTRQVPILSEHLRTTIEDDFLSLMQRAMLTPDESKMLMDFVALGIPDETILQGIRNGFNRYKPVREGDRIKRLTYCRTHVLDLHEVHTYKPEVNSHGITKQHNTGVSAQVPTPGGASTPGAANTAAADWFAQQVAAKRIAQI